MAIVVRGDALVPSDVEAAFAQIEEVDAVVSTIGGTPADPRADAEVRHALCQKYSRPQPFKSGLGWDAEGPAANISIQIVFHGCN